MFQLQTIYMCLICSSRMIHLISIKQLAHSYKLSHLKLNKRIHFRNSHQQDRIRIILCTEII